MARWLSSHRDRVNRPPSEPTPSFDIATSISAMPMAAQSFRDGSVIGARVTRQVDGSMRLLVTTETVGSGNYRNTDTFVLPKDGGV